MPRESTKWGGGEGREELRYCIFMLKKGLPLPSPICFVQLPKNKKAILMLDSKPYALCFQSSGSWRNPSVKGNSVGSLGVGVGDGAKERAALFLRHSINPNPSRPPPPPTPPPRKSPRNSRLERLPEPDYMRPISLQYSIIE